jgi:hypothetical protein
MRIHITSWNGKYALRFELDRYEQVFKVAEEDITLAEARELATQMSEEVLMRFVSMRSDFTTRLKAIGEKHEQ